MRRFSLIFPLIIALVVVMALMPGAVSGQGDAFQTNTPPPVEVNFATNTPSGPTNTPTPTLTPSVTPSATPTYTDTPSPTFTPTATFTLTDTPTPTPTPIGPFSYPEGINPLTGLMYPNEEAMARRNLIVKISNYPPLVRPQSGVNQADVVYEFEAEGGVTRFAAIFRSNAPDHVGSVRSARLSDTELIVMYNALLAYSGTSEPIQRIILAADWVYQTFSPLKGDGCEDAGFCRFPREGLALEHTLFLNTQTLWDLATRRNVNTGYKARGFAFNETPDSGGLPANDIFIDWYGQTDARWQFDATTGRYLRYTDGVAHFDVLDNQQLWADNIVIIEVPHNERPDLFPPGSNYQSLEIALWDQGRAYLIRDGQVYQGYWRRRDREPGSALQVIYGDNTPMMMKPGRTWVEVVRGFGDVAISENQQDMVATGTAIALSATPTLTITPGPSPTENPNS
ncbi:MAG: DUF3048 domain-containing protein [Anaerolineaceae bacterium]|nr:DUF3048 domain-containing protein [Anaerolineaceae bacterium]